MPESHPSDAQQQAWGQYTVLTQCTASPCCPGAHQSRKLIRTSLSEMSLPICTRLQLPQIHISKWMKKLEQVFFGGCQAYDEALQQPEGKRNSMFVAALLRNVYENDESKRPWALLLARYLMRWVVQGWCQGLSVIYIHQPYI